MNCILNLRVLCTNFYYIMYLYNLLCFQFVVIKRFATHSNKIKEPTLGLIFDYIYLAELHLNVTVRK